MTQRTYASAEDLKCAHTALCEQWLEECGTTKEFIQIASKPFVTQVPRFSAENLSRQKKRLENGTKLKLEFKQLLKIQAEIELIQNVLKGGKIG